MDNVSSSSAPAPATAAAAERKYRGVRMRKWGRWVSEIRRPNSRERIWLGSYDTPEAAARAFDAAFVCLRGGAEAGINFPDSPPAVAAARTSDPQEVYAAAVSHANRPPASARAAPPAAGVVPAEEAHVVVDKPDVAGGNVAPAPPPPPAVQVPGAGSFDWSQNPLYSPTCSYGLPVWMTAEAAAEESKEEEDDEGTSDYLWSFQYSPTHPS
ncbi:ethylene-responsive transcription factor ERF018-like [Oryza brachyantha]|uniref:AP2/ERF domain-containing protein n=1 Tax=Oryza brachyantha TaxID=4533 RepID=J3MC30_ORYBR|nr:ethylene-responsive transcription factor ERF018-like [Oryza brachyantha]